MTARRRIPETPRGEGIQTVDGFRTRTPWNPPSTCTPTTRLNMGNQRLVLLADVFNLFDTQRVTAYDQWTQLTGPGAESRFRRTDHAGPRRIAAA